MLWDLRMWADSRLGPCGAISVGQGICLTVPNSRVVGQGKVELWEKNRAHQKLLLVQGFDSAQALQLLEVYKHLESMIGPFQVVLPPHKGSQLPGAPWPGSQFCSAGVSFLE